MYYNKFCIIIVLTLYLSAWGLKHVWHIVLLHDIYPAVAILWCIFLVMMLSCLRGNCCVRGWSWFSSLVLLYFAAVWGRERTSSAGQRSSDGETWPCYQLCNVSLHAIHNVSSLLLFATFYSNVYHRHLIFAGLVCNNVSCLHLYNILYYMSSMLHTFLFIL